MDMGYTGRRIVRANVALTFVLSALAATMHADTKIPDLVIGDKLPTLSGEFLTGRQVALPEASAGKVRLLVIGFTYQSRFPVEAWSKRFREAFEKNPQVTFFEIPMIGGMARMGKWFIDSGMRRGTPKADQENVITVYGGIAPWKSRLKVKDENTAHLVLLDQAGKVAWLHSGAFDETAFETLSSEVAKLLAK
jgi:hypothetical protein